MGYSGHTVTRPRSVLVIIGGMLAWLGLVSGVLLTTPQFHLAMTMKEEPVEMTWQELVDNGLTDNSYVRLIDVALDDSQPPGFFDELLQLDPDADPQDQQQAFEDFAQTVDFGEMIDAVLEPLKVYPKGMDAADFPSRVVVPQGTWVTEAAIDEITTSGTLTGRFTLNDGSDLSTRMAKAFIAAAMSANQGEQNNGPGPIDEQGIQDADQALGEDAAAEDGPPLKYVFQPVGSIPNAAEAQQWFWLSGFAVAIGLVICGAGGPSIYCCFFFQVPSILSMFGYPMRYGRATKTTRVFYTAVGIGLIGYGYQIMVTEGKIGQLDGDILMVALGFVPTFFGAAAVLGAAANVIATRLNLSLEPASTKKNNEPKIDMSLACSLEPTAEELAVPYSDRSIVTCDDPLPEQLQEMADSLASVSFQSHEGVACQDGFDTRPVLIQLGCQGMVVADVELIDGQLLTRLASVLQDGLTIITLSGNFPGEKDKRFGTNGLYLRSQSCDPIEMLSAHLEETIGMAEKRDTTVITVDPCETIEVTALARRVLADVQAQYGEASIEVDWAIYGRFKFPPRPVPTHASV